MKRRKAFTIIAVTLAMLLSAGIGAYAASTYGSSTDPLVSLSYIEEVLTPKLLSQLQDELAEAVSGIEGGVESYAVVTLSRGQTLSGGVGCEILLRIGSATVTAADSPGLVDSTAGNSIDSGASLAMNHLYLVTIKGNGVTAASDTVKLMVRGAYTVS